MTDVPKVAETWLDELDVTQPGDSARGNPFRILIGGLGTAFGRLHDIVRDTDDGPGWSPVLDPDRAPAWALPWLAQFAGVRLTTGLSEAGQRAEIASPPVFERGTQPAMLAAVQNTLTGAKDVLLVERDPTPYDIAITTKPAQTPDAAATEAAARSQKPAGLALTYTTADF